MMVSGPLFQGGGKFIIKKQIPLISHKHIVPIILVLLFAANSLCRQSYQLADGLRPQLHGEYDLHKIRKTLDWVNSPDRKLILHPSPCNDDGKRYKRPHTSQATTFPVFQQKKSLPDNDDDRLDDISNASNEAQLEELNKEIVRELGPAHPIYVT